VNVCAATPADLARVKASATQVDSMRFEIFTSMESPLFDMESRMERLVIGSQPGDQSRFALDMGSMMGPAAVTAGLDPKALTKTTVVRGQVTSVNAPFFAECMR
jgi:hypothetical protein